MHGLKADQPQAKLGPIFIAPVSVDGVTRNALVDTGSPCTIILLNLAMEILKLTRPFFPSFEEWREAAHIRSRDQHDWTSERSPCHSRSLLLKHKRVPLFSYYLRPISKYHLDLVSLNQMEMLLLISHKKDNGSGKLQLIPVRHLQLIYLKAK